MVDVVTPEKRSRMMAGIRGANTRPEMLVRKGLYARGFRYRLHNGTLPGRPDLVLRKYRAVIFINGCFWHGHDCHLFKWPKSRPEFWRAKIEGNRERDQRNRETLLSEDWRVAEIWECALKGKTRWPLDGLLDRCATWLEGRDNRLEIAGNE